MAFLFDTEEQVAEATAKPMTGRARVTGSDAEIMLGTRSLLGIFFGLVLVCSLFFGLGYSVGRGSAPRGAAAAAADQNNAASQSHFAKPSADLSTNGPPIGGAPATDSSSSDAQENSPEPETVVAENAPAKPQASPAPAPQISKPSAIPPAAAASATSSEPATPPAIRPAATATQPMSAPAVRPMAPGAQNFMVQIAAVRLPEDANILVSALQKRGYTAVVRNEPQDQLLHVQMGPYSSRADAAAMKSRLLADGYNAVIK